jgi:hypothetical protein
MRKDTDNGIEYAPGIVGKTLFRVSERYVADHVAPLIAGRRVDAVKLDLVLRGLALSPQHAGKRRPGLVLRHRNRLDWPALHDLVRDPHRFATERPEDHADDTVERDKKREWVREQLQILEGRSLLTREDMGDGRRQIRMLSDLSTGDPFDDPGDKTVRRSYLTIHGHIVSSADFRDWGAPDLVGYICANVADRFARADHAKRTGEDLEPGAATWFRQAEWFNNANGYRGEGHVALPFSTTTIERGLKAMRDRGYVTGERKKRAPTGERLQHPRMIYTNHFHRPAGAAPVIDINTRQKLA